MPIMLECVAGKDEHRRIAVDGHAIKIGPAAAQPALVITELEPSQGWLTVRVDDGTLVMDASSCTAPVYVNNHEVLTSPLRERDVLRIGSSVWRARYGAVGLTTEMIR